MTKNPVNYWYQKYLLEKQKNEQIIDKACEYMRNHIDPQLTIYHEQTWCKRDEFINKLKKVMEDRK